MKIEIDEKEIMEFIKNEAWQSFSNMSLYLKGDDLIKHVLDKSPEIEKRIKDDLNKVLENLDFDKVFKSIILKRILRDVDYDDV